MIEAQPNEQEPVDRFFDAAAGYWYDVYGRKDLQGRIYRERLGAVADWTRALALTPGAAVLDAGCGAGLMTIELAGGGFTVTGTDSSAEMVRSTRRLAAERGLADRITVTEADAHRLPFPDGAFELVVALGLLPWLHDAQGGVTELARVLAPGGWLILTADNRLRLNRMLEPRENPLLSGLRPLKRALRPPPDPSEGAQAHRHGPQEVDAMLARAGLTVGRRATIGYGPFTILGRPALPDEAGTWLHTRLDGLAGRHPRLRSSGWHYLVQSRRDA